MVRKHAKLPSWSFILPRKDGQGRINITLCNLDHENGAEMSVDLRGISRVKNVTGTVLTADKIQAHNTFGFLRWSSLYP